MAEPVYLSGDINSADTNGSIEINRSTRVTRARLQTYRRLCDRPSAQLLLKIRLLGVGVETMLHECATWTPRSGDFEGPHAAHHKHLLRADGSRREERSGNETSSYRDGLEITNREHVGTTVHKRPL